MPPESRLDMPTQSLRRWSAAQERKPVVAPQLSGRPGSRACSSSAARLLLTAYGACEMYQVVSVSRTTVLQWVLLALFTINFSWIAVAFTSALLGFLVLLRQPRRRRRAAEQPAARTAVVMPVYNEPTARDLRRARGDPRIRRGDGPRRRISTISSSPTPPIRTPGSPRSAPSWPCASASARTRASTIATGRRTTTARPATSPIS